MSLTYKTVSKKSTVFLMLVGVEIIIFQKSILFTNKFVYYFLFRKKSDKLNTINLTALSVFLIYFLSITLLPIANSAMNAEQNNLFVNRNSNIKSYAQVLKLKTKTNPASTVDTTTYINNGQILARQINSNNLQSYINDAKSSVLKLNSADKSQNQIYNYDAYGKPIANAIKLNSALSVANPFQYNGERFDSNTALQYLCARFYNVDTKRFINQDTYNLLNRFGYVNSNPVMSVDSTGHDATGWIKDAWNSATNSISGAFGANSIWSQVILGASLGIAAGLVISGGIYTTYKLKNILRKKTALPVSDPNKVTIDAQKQLELDTILAISKLNKKAAGKKGYERIDIGSFSKEITSEYITNGNAAHENDLSRKRPHDSRLSVGHCLAFLDHQGVYADIFAKTGIPDPSHNHPNEYINMKISSFQDGGEFHIASTKGNVYTLMAAGIGRKMSYDKLSLIDVFPDKLTILSLEIKYNKSKSKLYYQNMRVYIPKSDAQ